MDKLFGMLSLCRRAGKLQAGYDAALEAAAKREAKLVLLCSDLSPKTAKNFRYELGRMDSPPRTEETGHTMEMLAPAVGRRAGILAVCDDGFSQGITAIIETAKRAQEEQL